MAGIDDEFRSSQPKIEERNEALAARNYRGIVFCLVEKTEHLFGGVGSCVLERLRLHGDVDVLGLLRRSFRASLPDSVWRPGVDAAAQTVPRLPPVPVPPPVGHPLR